MGKHDLCPQRVYDLAKEMVNKEYPGKRVKRAQAGLQPLEEIDSVGRWSLMRGHALGCRVVQASLSKEVTQSRGRMCVGLKENLPGRGNSWGTVQRWGKTCIRAKR